MLAPDLARWAMVATGITGAVAMGITGVVGITDVVATGITGWWASPA